MTHYYNTAEELAEVFNGELTGENYHASLLWPSSFSLLGRALEILYWSTKAV